MEELLPGNVYRVVQLAADKQRQHATTAHVAQLKSWLIQKEDESLEEVRPNEEEDKDKREIATQKERREIKAPVHYNRII